MGSVWERVNWQQLGKLVLMIAAVQAVYWLVINDPIFRVDPGEAPPMAKILSARIARLDTPSLADAAEGRYEPVSLPWTYCCDTAVFAVRIRFAADTIPRHGLGIISDLEVDNYILAVNGTVLQARGSVVPGKGSFHGQVRSLTRIPSGVLKPGVNELTYVTLRDGFPYTDILAPRIADYNALDRYSARTFFFVSGYPLVAGAVLGLLGMLATIMIFRSDDWKFASWLSALCAAFVAYFGYALWLDPPVDGFGRMLAFFAISQAIPATMLCFIDSWTQHPVRWLQSTTAIVYGAAVLSIGWYLYTVPMPDGFDVPTSIWIWHLMGSAIAVMLRLLWHFATQREDRLVESGLLSVMAVALLLDASSAWFPEQHLPAGNVRNSAVFLLLAMVAAFLARNFRLFQSQGALNAMLQAKVEQREAELVEAAQREQALIRQQAFDEERRRIMRDLHDGLGSQLMSIMLSARVGVAEPAAVAEGLQSVIDEMRLMVDSMDSVGESLGSALATFRARVQPRVQAVGIDFVWTEDDSIGAISTFGPRDVLQIFRVLQEAVTNALKHAECGRIAVTATRTDDGLALEVADDGKGLALVTHGGAGRGWANMQARAQSVNGVVSILPGIDGRGTRIVLALPLGQVAPAQGVAAAA